MNYSVSQFRANMGAILDETRYERKITTIGRRNKQEFVVIPIDIIKKIDSRDAMNDFIVMIDKLNIEKKGADDKILVDCGKEGIGIEEFEEYLSYKKTL